jgi:uncharacterized membrane protein YhaH (DUF805 family)
MKSSNDSVRLLRLFFGFGGRVGRLKYWITSIVSDTVLVLAGLILDSDDHHASSWRFFFDIFFMMLGTLAIVATLAVYVKRLHDRDKSGWWVLLFLILPITIAAVPDITGKNVASFAGDDKANLAFVNLVAFVLTLWGFVELGFLSGTRGPNKYGERLRASS